MATLALSTANPRPQSSSLAAAVENGSDRAAETSPANAFATLLNQLGPATPAPSPAEAAPVAPILAPSSTAVLPPPTMPPMASITSPPPLLATGSTVVRESPSKESGAIKSDEEVAPEASADDAEGSAQPNALPQPTALPVPAPLPPSAPLMTVATGLDRTASPSLPDQLTVGSVPSSIKPVPLAPQGESLVAADADPEIADDTVASPANDEPTNGTTQTTSSPAPHTEPASALERAAAAQSRTSPPSPATSVAETATDSDSQAKVQPATTPKSGGAKTDVTIKTSLSAATFSPSAPSPASVTSSQPLDPQPTAPFGRRVTDPSAPSRAESSVPTSSKSVGEKSAADVSSPLPAVPLDIAPITTSVPSVQTTASAATLPVAPPSTNATPPSTPAAQVATALVEPVAVMITTPPASPAQPHVTTIQITPVELGRVDIRIERPSDGPAKIELVAERPETLSRLVHDQSVLHHALDQAGLAAGNRTVEFSLAPVSTPGTSSGTLSNHTASSDGGNGGSHRQGGRYPNQDFAADDTRSSSSTVFRSIRSGLDITA